MSDVGGSGTSRARPVGATPVADDEGRKRRPAWLWWLLALVAVVLGLLLLSQCMGDDDPAVGTAQDGATEDAATDAAADTATDTATQTETGTETGTGTQSPTATGTGAAADGGTLTVGGQPLLPLTTSAPDGDLSAYDGQAVTGSGVSVLAVPADEGFWVGSSETDRVWVQLTGQAGESPYEVEEGDQVDLEGSMVTHADGFAEEVGVTAEEGAGQLTTQGAHIEVPKASLSPTE